LLFSNKTTNFTQKFNNMEVKIESSWKERLAEEFEKPYFTKLIDFVKDEYQNHTVYPAGKLIFNAFEKTPFDQVKVVIIGQDPYHGAGQANGLCFSVSDGIKIPPSLINIFKDIKEDLGKEIPKSGNLERWAKQGVFLLNAILTVRANTAGSHQKKGWEEFTDAVIKKISDEKEGVVFMLWGNYAHKKGAVIDTHKHLVLKDAHPSPLAKGYGGKKHFSQVNQYLKSKGLTEIEW
jgi:uracil-DNA glycosylase